MQAWNQWGAPTSAAAAYSGYAAPPPQAATAAASAAPPVSTSASAYSLGYHQYYSAAPPLPSAAPDFTGWTALQQQQWQQWQQWQQQFQQWQQQYGDKYQESVNAMMAGGGPPTPATSAALPSSVPDLNQPPPLPPADSKATPIPPPPPEERSSDPYSTFSQFSTLAGKGSSMDSQSVYGPFMSGGPFSVPPPSVPPPPSHPPPPQPSLVQSVPPPPSGVPPPPSANQRAKTPTAEDYSNKGYSTAAPSVAGKRSYEQDYQSGNDSFGDTPKKSRNEGYSSSGDRPQSTGYVSGNREEKSGSQRNSGGSREWSGTREKGEHSSSSRASKDNPDELLEAEKTFDIQFKHWEEQFAKWKEQNINHPDKVQYKEYEAKWEAWKENLLQRRTQMRRKREAAIKQQQQQQAQDGQLEVSEIVKSGADTTPNRSASASGRRGGAGTPGSLSGYFSGGDASRASEEHDSSKAELAQDDANAGGFNFAAVGGGFPGQAVEENKNSLGFDVLNQNAYKVPQSSVPFLDKGADSKDVSKDPPQKDEDTKDFISKLAGGIPGLDLIMEGKSGNESSEESKAREEERQLSVGHDKDERENSQENQSVGPVNNPQVQDRQNPDSDKQVPPGQESEVTKSFSPNKSGVNQNQGLLGSAPLGPGFGGFGQQGQGGGAQNLRGLQGPNQGGQSLLGFPGSNPSGNFQNHPGFPGPPPLFGQGPPPGYGGSGPPPYGGGSMYNGPPPNSPNFRQGSNYGPGNQSGGFGPANQQGGFGSGNQQGGFGPGNRGGSNFNNQGQNQHGGFGNNRQFGNQPFGQDKAMNSKPGDLGDNNLQGTFGSGNQEGNQNFGNRGTSGPAFGQNQLNPHAFSGNSNESGFLTNLNPQAFSGLPGPGPNQNFGNKPPPLLGNKVGASGGTYGPSNQGPSSGSNQGLSLLGRPSSNGGSDGPGGQLGSGGAMGAGGASGQPFGGPPGSWKDAEKGMWGREDPSVRDNFPGGLDPRDNFPQDFQDDREGFTGPRDNFEGPPRDGFFAGGKNDHFPTPSETGGPRREFNRAGGLREDHDYREEFEGRAGRGRGGGFGGWHDAPRGRGSGIGVGGRGGGRGRFRDEPGMGMEPPPSLLGDGPALDAGRPWDRKDKDDPFRDRWKEEGPPRRFTEPPPPKGWMGSKAGDSRPWPGGNGGPGGNRVEDRFAGPRPWERGAEWDKLEPATIVDYGHRPVAADAIPGGNTFVEPVQTFDYGHGSSTRRPDVPPIGPAAGGPVPSRAPEPWRREEPPPNFRGNREREERFNREREWPRGGGGNNGVGGWDQEKDFAKRESHRWERDRERDRGRLDSETPRERDRDRERDDRERDRERDRDRDRDRDRKRDEKNRWGDDNDRVRSGAGDRWGRDRDRRDRDHRERGDLRGDGGGKEWGGGGGNGGGGAGPGGNTRFPQDARNDRPQPADANFPPPPDAPPPPTFAPAISTETARAVLIEDLLCPPGRTSRPTRLVMILRGPPGSGKTFVAKLIKDKEVEMGGSAPRILCLDDYFMVEMEKEDKDPETGRKIITKVMEYEYEAGMDKHYRSSLVKAFRKTILDGYFPFIIVDCINDKVKHFEEMWSFAKQKGFQVYVCEMDMDASVCSKRNIHNRSEKDILDIIKNWEETPKHILRVDIRSLLQSVAITEVEMEDTTVDDVPEEVAKPEDGIAIGEVTQSEAQEGDEELADNPFTSKWDRFEPTGEKLDRLDGLARRRKADDQPKTLEDWLQLTDDYNRRGSGKPGQKRVRWADLEERHQQEKMRAIGFVVGQTDWSRMTDPTFGESALTQTKYI